MTDATARLVELVGPLVDRTGHDLEGLTVTVAGRRSVVRIAIDKDGGVTLDEVAEVSRALGEALDAADQDEPGLLGPSYVLEVSSPGVDRPLTEPRHWRRNAGRLVTATMRDAAAVTGRVAEAGEQTVTLEVDGNEQRLAYADVVRAAVQVEFSPRNDETPA